MRATLTAADAAQLERVVDLVRDVLGPHVVGVYLHGSAALGTLRPHSDLDVLAVLRRPSMRDEKRRLAERLLAISGHDGRHVELTIVVESEVRPSGYPPRLDFQYGDWWRREIRKRRGRAVAVDDGSRPRRVAHDGAAREPRSVRAAAERDPRSHPAPRPASRRDGRARRHPCRGRARHAQHAPHARSDLVHPRDRRHPLKDAAADWAIVRLPDEHRRVLARACAVYVGEEQERWDDLEQRIRPHADYVVAEIERIAAQVAE